MSSSYDEGAGFNINVFFFFFTCPIGQRQAKVNFYMPLYK